MLDIFERFQSVIRHFIFLPRETVSDDWWLLDVSLFPFHDIFLWTRDMLQPLFHFRGGLYIWSICRFGEHWKIEQLDCLRPQCYCSGVADNHLQEAAGWQVWRTRRAINRDRVRDSVVTDGQRVPSLCSNRNTPIVRGSSLD